jgi:pyruvate dehydrogenase E2 component (dihydrolipoamide acetyltransferase)
VYEFRMPLLGADMESGLLVEWLIQSGQKVKRGDIVAVVETEKGAVDVEIWESGVVDTLLVPPGTEVPVGGIMATLRAEGEAAAVPTEAVSAAPSIAPAAPAPPPRVPAAAPDPAVAAAHYKVSPAARRRAEQLGVDLSGVTPSGPERVVSLADVERAAQGATAPAPPIPDKQEAMRQAIATAMAKSKREIPHYYLGSSIDITRAIDWLAEENRKRSIKDRVLLAAVLLRAVVLALRDVPELNGLWVDKRFQHSDAVHLAVGIALRGGGLIAPAIRDAQLKAVPELMASLSDLIRRARGGGLRSSELTDATVTVTNLGEQGVETVYGVIYPPQVALVGFGRVSERPWVVDGAVLARKVIYATLSADHRASVGHRGALFLAGLERLLQEPEKLA